MMGKGIELWLNSQKKSIRVLRTLSVMLLIAASIAIVVSIMMETHEFSNWLAAKDVIGYVEKTSMSQMWNNVEGAVESQLLTPKPIPSQAGAFVLIIALLPGASVVANALHKRYPL